jgi:colanic acid biosynthesis glycosyl transferase WcaI
LDVVLEAAIKFCEKPDIVFVLAGDGAMKSRLVQRTVKLGLGNVQFLPLQERSEFLQMLAATDLALIVQQSSVSDIVFPSKTVTLLSAARPVVASVSANSEIGRVIRQSLGGIVTEPENVEALAAAIHEFSGDTEKRLATGKCGRQYALHHWDEIRILSNFEAHLMKTCAAASYSGNAERPTSIQQK